MEAGSKMFIEQFLRPLADRKGVPLKTVIEQMDSVLQGIDWSNSFIGPNEPETLEKIIVLYGEYLRQFIG